MKKFLPALQKTSGFTLIELLVVVAIISVLAIMAFAVFSGLTGKGNDARRQADIKAIADALEVTRGSSTTYVTVPATAFSGGTVPKEPTPRLEKYCYLDGTAAIANPGPWTGTPCPPASSWASLQEATSIVVTAGATFFKVCTINQATPPGVICYGSRQ